MYACACLIEWEMWYWCLQSPQGGRLKLLSGTPVHCGSHALFDCTLGFTPVLTKSASSPLPLFLPLCPCHITPFHFYCKSWRRQSDQRFSHLYPGSSHVLKKNRASAQWCSRGFSCTSRDLLLKNFSLRCNQMLWYAINPEVLFLLSTCLKRFM